MGDDLGFQILLVDYEKGKLILVTFDYLFKSKTSLSEN